jgi:UDP-3-O-[3-hydroxymyristoyl] glucosamine N-acyltransferase
MSPPQARRAFRLEEICRAVAGTLVGGGDALITGVSSLDEAGAGDLAYIASDRFAAAARRSGAAAFVVGRPVPELQRPQIVVPHPAYAFARAALRRRWSGGPRCRSGRIPPSGRRSPWAIGFPSGHG